MKTRLFVIGFLFLVFWGVWQEGAGVATDYIYWWPEELGSIFGLPYTWRGVLGAEGMGQSVVSTLWSWPAMFVYSLLSRVGLGFGVISRLVGFLPVVLVGVYSIDKLFESYKLNKWARVAGSLVYLANTYIVLLIDGGQIFIALAYAVLPLAFYFYKSSKTAAFVAAVLFISFLDPRIILFVFILAGIETVFTKQVMRFVTAVLLSVLAYAGVHAYWIFPALVYPSSFSGGIGVGSGAWELNFVTIGHALNLVQPHWYRNVFGKVVYVDFWFAFIPVLAFLAPVVKKRSKKIAFWLVVLVIGIFFAKGVNPPIGEVYEWMSANVPGFWLFRDSTKFYFLISLAFAVLASFTISKVGRVGMVLVVVYFVVLLNPVWRGKMTGYVSAQPYLDSHSKVNGILEGDNNFGRVLWIPSVAPSSYSSPTHPQVLGYVHSQARPFVTSRVGGYEVYNYLREEGYVGDLLDVSSIKYLAYPYPDTRREELSEDNIDYYQTFLGQLERLDWVEGKLVDKPMALLSVKRAQDRFFIADRAFLVYGSEQIYNDFSGELELSDNALVFAEEDIGNYGGLDIVLHQKDRVDVAASVFGEDYIFPAGQLGQSPDGSGWWKRDSNQYFEWRSFLQEKWGLDLRDFDYGGGVAISEGRNNFQFSIFNFQKGDKLLVRVMVGTKGGTLTFRQGGKIVGAVETKVDTDRVGVNYTLEGEKVVYEYDEAYYKWFEVGSLAIDGQLEIESEGGINAVNAIVAVSERAWQEELGRERNLLRWEEAELVNIGETAQVNYRQINPAEYEVEVSGLSKPGFLVFTDSFDENWRLGDRTSIRTYSLVNGFWVEKDGVYKVYYAPQGLVIYGMVVSVISGMSVILWLAYPKIKK